MRQTFQHFFKLFLLFWTITMPIQAAVDTPIATDYKGYLTCKNLEHFRVYTNDPRFVPFCSDASKGCFIREQLDKLPDIHPLRGELDTKLENHLAFNFGLCEVAILAFEPRLYKDEFER